MVKFPDPTSSLKYAMSVAVSLSGILGVRSRLRPLLPSLVGCASCNNNNNDDNINNESNNNNNNNYSNNIINSNCSNNENQNVKVRIVLIRRCFGIVGTG